MEDYHRWHPKQNLTPERQRHRENLQIRKNQGFPVL
jgi:hypothetical protein